MEIESKFRTLIDVFNESLAEIKSPDKICLEIIRADREESLTFRQLKAGSRDFAVWMIQSQGIRVGDKIAIVGKNRTDWDIALWGVILAGAIPVLIDPERPVEGVINHLRHTDSKLDCYGRRLSGYRIPAGIEGFYRKTRHSFHRNDHL